MRIHDLCEKGRITEGLFASYRGDRFGLFMMLHSGGGFLKVIACAGDVADGEGGSFGSSGTRWDHVSVSLKDRTPTWAEMAWIKSLFWTEEDCVVEYHPPKSRYVNNSQFVLHLWKPLDAEIPMPPTVCV